MRRPSLTKRRVTALSTAAVTLRDRAAREHGHTADDLMIAARFLEELLQHKREADAAPDTRV